MSNLQGKSCGYLLRSLQMVGVWLFGAARYPFNREEFLCLSIARACRNVVCTFHARIAERWREDRIFLAAIRPT